MIDPDVGTPVYRQVADALRARIVAGELPAGYPLPAEGAIGAEYGVSRTTARRAVEELRIAGEVVTRKGWGSYVRGIWRHRVELAAGTVAGRPATRRDARIFGVPVGAPMLTIRRGQVEIGVPADRVEVHVRERRS